MVFDLLQVAVVAYTVAPVEASTTEIVAWRSVPGFLDQMSIWVSIAVSEGLYQSRIKVLAGSVVLKE